jgi:hypothetical protein
VGDGRSILGDDGDVTKVVARLESIPGEDLVEGNICVCSFVGEDERVVIVVVVTTVTAMPGAISSMQVVKSMEIKKRG